MGVSSEII
jgi:hypothetical protein